MMFSAAEKTSTSLKCWWIIPMPRWKGVLRRTNVRALPVDEDFALVWIIDAAEHVHQRGFAAAVFAEQRQDLALAKLEVDPVVRNDRAETLGDVVQLDGIFRADSAFRLVVLDSIQGCHPFQSESKNQCRFLRQSDHPA